MAYKYYKRPLLDWQNLPKIETIGELKKHMGEVLCFWFGKMFHSNEDGSDVRLGWMCVVDDLLSKNLNDGHTICGHNVEVQGSNLVDIISCNEIITSKPQVVKNLTFDGQEFIAIPSKELLLYYNIILNKCINKKI